MRTCKTCGIPKELDQFPAYVVRGKRGYRRECKTCWNKKWSPIVTEHNKRYYHENISGMRDSQKARTAKQHRASWLKHAERNQAYAHRHPEREAAKVQVKIAVRSGRLKRQLCVKCGAKAQCHHDDYSKPLDVMWLCPFHHGERHRFLNRFGADMSDWPESLRVQQFPEVRR